MQTSLVGDKMPEYKLCFLNIESLDSENIKTGFEAMSDERKKESLALVTENKKLQKIAADMLCRQMIAEADGVDPSGIIIKKDKNGKPYAENSRYKFSISHCGNLVVCAVSKNDIGVDVEKIRNVRLKMAEKFACESEIEYIGDKLERFFEIWTLKEAYFKCKGTGLGADIKSVSFDVTDSNVICSENGYNLFFENVADGCICSVCICESH